MNCLRRAIMVLLACFCVIGNAKADSDCLHKWTDFDYGKHGYDPEKVTLEFVDDEYHCYKQSVPTSVCEYCGERMYEGRATATSAVHSFQVKDWNLDADTDELSLCVECAVCKYVREEWCNVQHILEGKVQSCILGGKCDDQNSGYLNQQGSIIASGTWIVPPDFDMGEASGFVAVVYDEEEKIYQFSAREYCPLCGRPRAVLRGWRTPDFREEWDGLPVMSEEDFLTVGMPQDLPYQLIDQLRKEAGAA